MFQVISLLSQVTVAVLCIALYKKYKNQKFYVFFLTLIVLIAVVELVGTYFIYTDVDSHYMSYFFVFFQGVFSMLMFKFLLKKNKIVYFLFSLFFFFWIYYFKDREAFDIVVIMGSINIAVFSLLHLRELLMSDKIFVYKKILPFWVSSAFLIFYLSSVPFFSMLDFMHTRGLFFVLYILIILMNTFIIYGLLCSKKEEKY